MNYNTIDLIKFLFAFTVIAIHTVLLDDATYDFVSVLQSIGQLAVPFFFITSGFFLGKKVKESEDEMLVYKAYIRRILKLYVLWSILYIPVNLYYELYIYGSSAPSIALRMLRGWLLVGENACSWPLWYLLASLVGVMFIAFCRRHQMKFSKIFVCSLVAFIVGYCYQTYHSDIRQLGIVPLTLSRIYDWTFMTTRNGIFVGWVYLSIGMSLSMRNQKTLNTLGFAGGVILAYFNYQLALLPIAYGLVGIALSVQLPGNIKIYKQLRLMSVMIFLIHMFAIVLLVNSVANMDKPQLFINASVITLIISLLLCQLMRAKHFRWIKQLF